MKYRNNECGAVAELKTSTGPQSSTHKKMSQYSSNTKSIKLEESDLFPFQVSGHDLMIRARNGELIKLASNREVRFYDRVFAATPQLKPFIAQYYGVRSLSDDVNLIKWARDRVRAAPENFSPWTTSILLGEPKKRKPGKELIAISDLTSSFEHPNIVDIKLGQLHHSQTRSVMKPVKYATAISLGFCIGGMLRWNPRTQQYRHVDKYAGRELNEDNIGDILLEFVGDAEGRVQKAAVSEIIRRLERLHNIFACQTTWRFHSTSLLLIWEQPGDDMSHCRVEARLVDFAHAYMNHYGQPGFEPRIDHGCALGVQNLLLAFKTMQRSSSVHDDLNVPFLVGDVPEELANVQNVDGGSGNGNGNSNESATNNAGVAATSSTDKPKSGGASATTSPRDTTDSQKGTRSKTGSFDGSSARQAFPQGDGMPLDERVSSSGAGSSSRRTKAMRRKSSATNTTSKRKDT